MDTLQGMRVFARVVDSGSFTSAAQALDLSTAQVSRLISDLEAHLQTRLLHRTTRRLALTEAGERYLERCRGILEDIEVAEAEAAGAHIRPCGRLRVQSLMGMGQHHLVPMIARYGALFPDVVIELTLSQRNPDMLEEGQDVLITGERQLPDSEFVAQRLGSIHSVLCASPGYLQQHGVPHSVDDLERHVCLRLQDPAYPEGWIFADEQGERTVSPQNTFMVNVAEVMAQAAKADLGIALLPSYVAPRRCATASCYGCCPAMPCTSGPSMRCIPRGVTWTRRSAPGSICCNRNFPGIRPRRNHHAKFKLLGTVKDCCY